MRTASAGSRSLGRTRCLGVSDMLRSSDDVALDQRPAGGEPVEAERRQVERPVLPVYDQLGDGASDTRRLLDAVAGEAVGEVEVGDFRMRADDPVLVDHVVFVVAGPGVRDAQLLEG